MMESRPSLLGRRLFKLGLVVAVLSFWGRSVRAHDVWLELSDYHPNLQEEISIRLFEGDHFRGMALPRNPRRIVRFSVLGPDGEQPVAGQMGAEPAGSVQVQSPGLHVVSYVTHPLSIELDAERFEHHLHTEGLVSILEQRAQNGESEKSARELYSRSVKALFVAGEGDQSAFDRALGLPLELIPRENPFWLESDGELPVQLLYRGKPLAGVLVVARQRENPQAAVQERTDPEGLVRLRLDRSGVWLIKAIHMFPAPEALHADWISIWAALTIETRVKEKEQREVDSE